MRFSLRTLLIALTLGPPALAFIVIAPRFYTPGQAGGIVILAAMVVGAIAGFGSMILDRRKSG